MTDDAANSITVTITYTTVELGDIFMSPWNHDDEEEGDDE